ncbi:hypothetical protein JRO89_XS05G0166700 [Xanthoceras sorbifolium]|uniref:Bifunctional inhibitor/plant lipid transfer protein/seed storage helical domain-containing protein n=1 Tax=Xanthoceras sorbifolium TaxID=99658 RepID=A0ABQ8I277_9ROSI|nr:hypothetical protein JRO89_XS05G0166700 [Xanthoceras sorbifolium]
MAMDLHYLVLVSMLIISSAMGDKAKDREECTDQLVGLSTCLPYVGGEAKAPTPDCCSGLKQVLNKDKKCLCVIVRDRNDPELGLNINVTLALGLPSVCHQPANVSQSLLHMDPNSPEAQVFYQFDKSSDDGGSSPAPAPTPSPTAGGNTMSSKSKGTNHGCCNGKRWLELEVVFGGALLLYFFI